MSRRNLFTYILALTLPWAGTEAWLRLTHPEITPETVRRASVEYDGAVFGRSVLPQTSQPEFGINRRGYRGPPFDVPKPPGTVRVIVLGGSAAFDPNQPPGQDWPHQLQERVRRKGYTSVEVINAGVPGLATGDLLGHLYSELWMFQPDYILVYEAWNDIKYFSRLSSDETLLRIVVPAPLHPGSRRIENPFIYYTGPVDELLCHSQVYVRLRMRYWYWRLGERGEGPAVGAPGGSLSGYTSAAIRQYELNLRLLVDTAREIGAVPVLLTQAHLATATSPKADRERIRYDWVGLDHEELVGAFADCDAALRRVALDKGIPLIDVSTRVSGRSALFTDHVHLSPAGSRAVARAVADDLLDVLRRYSPRAETDTSKTR